MPTPLEANLGLAGIYARFWRSCGRPSVPNYLEQFYWYSCLFSRGSGIFTFLHIELSKTLDVSKGCEPSVQRGVELWVSLGSPQGIRSSLHLVRCNMSLHLSHCRESWPSFESGHLRVHSTLGRKHRVPLTCLFLRVGSS